MVDRNPEHPGRLDAAFVKSVTKAGRYSDGPQAFGLSLLVRPTTRGGVTRRFQQRLTIDGRQTNVAIGSFPVITLAEARAIALDNMRAVRVGPTLAERLGQRVERVVEPVTLAPAFGEVVEMFIAANTGAWRRQRSLDEWRARVEAYALPSLGDRRIDGIATADVLDMLTPHWIDRHATANKVAQAVARVFAFAIARGLCTFNPADAKVLAAALPRVGKGPTHHEALPHENMADAILTVQESSASAPIKLCFEWTVLTACRSNEARGATWAEIDLEAREWTIPAERMKQARPHRVPLSKAALLVLQRAGSLRDKSGLLFPSTQGGQIHGATMTRLLRGLGVKSTVHGMRSAFRDWAAHAGKDHVLAELALAHAVGNSTERAYLRADLVEQRRSLMEEWAVAALPEEAFDTP